MSGPADKPLRMQAVCLTEGELVALLRTPYPLLAARAPYESALAKLEAQLAVLRSDNDK